MGGRGTGVQKTFVKKKDEIFVKDSIFVLFKKNKLCYFSPVMSGFTIDSPCLPIHVHVLDKASNKMVDGRKGIRSTKTLLQTKSQNC